MKKIGLFLLVATMGLFAACSSDKKHEEVDPETIDYAKEIDGKYKGDLSINLGEKPIKTEDYISLTRTKENVVKLELKDFTFAGQIKVGDIVIPDVEVVKEGDKIVLKKEKPTEIEVEELPGVEEGKVTVTITKGYTDSNGKLTLDLSIGKIYGATIEVKFEDGTKMSGNESAEAKLLSIIFDHEAVLLQPIVGANNTTTLYVKDDAEIKTLTEVPVTITISEKATVLPASGSKVDLSEGSTKFVVLAEDGTKVTYTVNVTHASLSSYNFEEWIIESGDLGIDLFAPSGGWATSNIGAAFLQGFTGVYTNVDKVEDAHGGKYAVKLTTLDSKGEKIFGKLYSPKVTPASLFTGTFDLGPAMSGKTLAATKFGMPFHKKPLALKGYYKYTAGEIFYECPDPKEHQTANENKNRTDEGSVNAILYEIANDTDDYLTGENAYTSEKLVARAEFNTGNQATYKEFSADFKFLDGKTYDAKKKYRIAIIASSSKDGDKFSGAPGSVLYLDDIEIISE